MKAAYKEPDYESIFRENEGKPLKTLIAIYQGKYVKLFWSVVFFLIKDSPSWISPLVMAAMIDIITKPDYPKLSLHHTFDGTKCSYKLHSCVFLRQDHQAGGKGVKMRSG